MRKLLFCWVWAAIGAGIPFASQAERERPNVLVILVDALRADHIGCYGYPLPTSPHIDRFAAESLRFENAFAQSPWTKPSIPSLFTSLYPIQHGVYEGEAHARDGGLVSDVLADEHTTMAEAFSRSGYRTAGFVHNAHLLASQGYAQGFDIYEQGRFDATELNERLLRFIDSGAGPFFGYVHYLDVHWPFQPEPRFAERFGVTGDRGMFGRASWHGLRNAINNGSAVLGPREREQLVALHDAGIAELDERFGELLAALEQRGVLDRTVVVVTSDHGEELLEHGQVGHGGTLFEEVVRIPLLIRLPGGERAGVSSVAARLLDVYPTLGAAVGIDPGDSIEGRDLISASGSPVEVVAETRHKRTYQVSVARDGWKYIRTYRAPRTAPRDAERDPTSGLAVGMRVKARGFFGSTGEFLAEKISVKDAADDDLELSGPVESVDSQRNRIAVVGYEVQVRDLLDSDGSAAVDSLRRGDWIKIEGDLEPNGSLVADKWKRLGEDEHDIVIEGLVDSVERVGRDRVVSAIGSIRVVASDETRINGLETSAAGQKLEPVPDAGEPPDPFSAERLRSGEGLEVSENLYDLGSDPAESVDRATRDPARRAALSAELDAWLSRMGRFRRADAVRDSLGESTIEELQALGYLE